MSLGGVKLQAQYQSATPSHVSSGNISVPLSSSGSYAYWNCNINLGSLTITKIEIKKSSPYRTWRITCTGSGTWTGYIKWSALFLGGSTDTFTLSSGTQAKTISCGITTNGMDSLGSTLVTGDMIGNRVPSVVLNFTSK